MTTNVIFNDKTIEVLDKQCFFEEGEKLFIEEDGKKVPHTITSISKVLRCTNGQCDVIQEIQVI